MKVNIQILEIRVPIAAPSTPNFGKIQNPNIKKKYDVIIIGGGGHGLATAFYLAKEFNIKNIAVLEKIG